MKADALSLAATLNSSEVDIYTIPQYQRPYTWNTQNFEVLWEDLSDSYNDFLSAKVQSRVPEYYFLGPVVFVKNIVTRSYDIIDGQQRTTTFHVLLWYLYKRVMNGTEKARIFQILTFLGESTKLKVSAKDAATFLKIRETDEEIEQTSRMAECANFFNGKIRELQDPDSFSEFLRDYTQFIVIVADDYSKAWDLFIGLNGKGEPLNPTDLVKAYVCGRSDVGDSVGLIWEERILRLKEDSTAYLLFLARFKAGKFISENSLFKEITKLFPGTLRVLDISEFSEVFHLFWHVAIEAIPKQFPGGLYFTLEAKKALRILRDVSRRDFTTLLFQYVQAFGIKSVFEESFLKLLASYQIRMAISGKRSREKKFISWFKELSFIQELAENDSRTDEEKVAADKQIALRTITQVLKGDAPDDTAFETYIQLAGYGNNPAKIILRNYEEGERGNKVISDFQLEHLMPQTGTEFWFPVAGVVDEKGDIDIDTYNSVINNIGNLFIIDATTNNDVKNYVYSVKKSFYQEHLQDWSIARITAAKDSWTPGDIKTRAFRIANWAKDYWKL